MGISIYVEMIAFGKYNPPLCIVDDNLLIINSERKCKERKTLEKENFSLNTFICILFTLEDFFHRLAI